MVLAAMALAGALIITPFTQRAEAATPSCASLAANVLERVNPANQSASLTLSPSVSAAAATDGYTSLREVSMRVGSTAAKGLVAVHWLQRDDYGGDNLYTASATEIAKATSSLGYTDRGVAFYASPVKASCLRPVYSYYKAGVHRFVATAADMAALKAAGWKKEKARFYARTPVADTTFSIAVLPDTQQEVLRANDTRFMNRTDWLLANRKSLDLRYVTHVGDVVNWDTDNHSQYAIAAAALKPLQDAGIPYSLSPGNHDTAAVCDPGGACDPHRTRVLVRDTSTFNRYFDHQGMDLEGAYEPGRVDNTYHIFTAGGVGWLVLNLELWPRPGAVAWAQQVVASHPKHNVIVVTHSYLTGRGKIYGKSEYGDTSPKVLSTKLIKKYPNIRLVFSGHAGTARHRVDKGVHGNRIDSFLLTMHSNTTNPVRLVTIDTKKRTLKTWVYAPYSKTSYSKYTVKLGKLSWVK